VIDVAFGTIDSNYLPVGMLLFMEADYVQN
jgi:hypothetical protein